MDYKERTVSIIGVPFCGGQAKNGVDLAPTHLRNAGIVSACEGLGWKVNYNEDVKVDPEPPTEIISKTKNPWWVGSVCKHVHDIVHQRTREDEFCLTIGGDHSIATGSISGILQARPNTCVIWVDAHADINTPDTSPSGNIHGMPVALLMGLAKEVPGFEWMSGSPMLAPSRIAYIGLRDVDLGERMILRQHGIAAFSMTDIDRHGIDWVLTQALARINPNRDRPVHLSFDIDGLDPTVAASTGTPVPGGLTLREGRHICESLASKGLLKSMDLVEINPLADPIRADDTLTAALIITKAALGHQLL